MKYDKKTLDELLKRIEDKNLIKDALGIVLEINNMIFEKEQKQ